MGWRIWTGVVVQTDSFSFSCDECENRADCNNNGECENGQCICTGEAVGNTCGIKTSCEEVESFFLGEEAPNFSPDDHMQLLRKTSDSPPVLAYGRPMYTAEGNGSAAAIFFTGTRWYYSWWDSTDFYETFFSEVPFHAYWDNVFEQNTWIFSETTESATPFGLKWNIIMGSGSKGNTLPFGVTIPLKGGSYCKEVDCSVTNVCGFYATCDNGTCICNYCFGGKFCEYAPNEDYALDAWINLDDCTNSSSAFYYAQEYWCGNTTSALNCRNSEVYRNRWPQS